MEAIKKVKLSEAVSQSVLKLISDGELKPGDRLPSEAQLCESLNVSRTAVREGIKAMVSMGILTVIQGRGMFVAQNPDILIQNDVIKFAFKRETIDKIYEVRNVLDIGVTRYAVLKATEDDIKALRKALEKTKKAVRSKPINVEMAIKGDEEFHLALCEATHNKILANISWPVINHIQLRGYKEMKASYEIIMLAIEGHEKIMEAIVNRDADMAIDAMREHLEIVFKRIYRQK